VVSPSIFCFSLSLSYFLQYEYRFGNTGFFGNETDTFSAHNGGGDANAFDLSSFPMAIDPISAFRLFSLSLSFFLLLVICFFNVIFFSNRNHDGSTTKQCPLRDLDGVFWGFFFFFFCVRSKTKIIFSRLCWHGVIVVCVFLRDQSFTLFLLRSRFELVCAVALPPSQRLKHTHTHTLQVMD
jgi:hypothetical protein